MCRYFGNLDICNNIHVIKMGRIYCDPHKVNLLQLSTAK